MSDFETDWLGDLIRRKRSCLAQLLQLGMTQLELVRAGRINELLELLAAKQHVLTQVQQLERQLDRFRGEDPQKRRWRTPEARQACAADLADCERLLAQIMAQEKQSEQELVLRRDEAAARLAGVHSAGEARSAYTAQLQPAAGRLNLVSEG